MRRALGRFLPIMLFALAVQLLAPIAVCFAASVASDALQGAMLCSGKGDVSQSEQPNPSHHSRDGSCAFCCGTASAPPADPVATIATVERQSYRVAWLAFLPGTLAARAGAIAQPRGPPTLS